uniref:MULE transposase domain-containing protein n=1 Tax=Strigamia maritima TaxID=126957 RepID=T1J9Q7_STRMM
MNVCQALPTKNALWQIIKQARQELIPKKPIDLDHLYFDAPFTEILDGKQFLAGAIDVDGKSLIFTTLNNLHHLCRASSILCDGTFKYLDYLQNFTHFMLRLEAQMKQKRILSVVYCLMERKTKESYIAVFQKIKWLTEFYGLELDPDNIISDFEIGAIKAAQEVFPAVCPKTVCPNGRLYENFWTNDHSDKRRRTNGVRRTAIGQTASDKRTAILQFI